MENKIGPIIRPVYESLEDFSKEIKLAKVQKVFFQVNVGQQEIEAQGKVKLPDGTETLEKVGGLRLTATITLSAIAYAPQIVGEATVLSPMHYVYSQSVGTKDCIEEADFDMFNTEIKASRDGVLAEVQKVANVYLFSGTISPT